MKIPDEHVLPCEFIVGHMRFGKGVKLETVRKASERWLKIAMTAYFKPDPEAVTQIDAMVKAINEGNAMAPATRATAAGDAT